MTCTRTFDYRQYVGVNPIDESFQPVFGLPSWNVKRGIGSFVTLEFGDPSVTVAEPKPMRWSVGGDDEPGTRKLMRRLTVVHGEWHLWIYCCRWRLTMDGLQLAHCESRDKAIERGLYFLNSQALTSVTVDPDDGTSTFVFDLGGVLETAPALSGTYSGEPIEPWMLYQPEARILTVRGDGHYSATASDSSTPEDWKPLPT